MRRIWINYEDGHYWWHEGMTTSWIEAKDSAHSNVYVSWPIYLVLRFCKWLNRSVDNFLTVCDEDWAKKYRTGGEKWNN